MPMTRNQISHRFNRTRKLVGHSKPVVFHQLRIRATTDAFRAGINMKTVKALGGWKSLDTVMRYQKLAVKDFIEANDKISSYKSLYN